MPQVETADSMLDFLLELTHEAATGDLALPIRYPMPEIYKISLTAETDNGANSASSPTGSLDLLSLEVSDEEDENGWQNEETFVPANNASREK